MGRETLTQSVSSRQK